MSSEFTEKGQVVAFGVMKEAGAVTVKDSEIYEPVTVNEFVLLYDLME